jgi:hypothetical protein
LVSTRKNFTKETAVDDDVEASKTGRSYHISNYAPQLGAFSLRMKITF